MSIALTVDQMRNSATSSAVGAVAGAPDRVHNGNIQLANMSGNKAGPTDQLYRQAIYELWPWLTSMMANDSSSSSWDWFWNAVSCDPSVRAGTIVRRKWVQLRRPMPAARAQEEVVVPAAEPEEFEEYPRVLYDISDKQKLKPLGLDFGPNTENATLYDDNIKNVQLGIEKRITEKFVPMDLTDAERDEIKGAVSWMVSEVESSPKVEDIAKWLLFGDYKSKKWTMKRAEDSLARLMAEYNPEFRLSAAIKLEPMGKDASGKVKPPRILIADGDAGALMAATTIGVLERWLVHCHKHRTIKGAPKAERMAQIVEASRGHKETKGNAAVLLENDGSAWDTCCSHALRELVENPIVEAVARRIEHLFTPLSHYAETHLKQNKKKKLKLGAKTGAVIVEQITKAGQYTADAAAREVFSKRCKESISAIRRSGHRGTSILNWILNLFCWSWVVAGAECKHFVKPGSKKFNDLFGVARDYLIWLEGDDSLLRLGGRCLTQIEVEELSRRWTKLGHRPKLYQRQKGDVAEYCGWKAVVDEAGMVPGTEVPDVPRLLRNLFRSTSKDAVRLAKTEGWRPIVAASLVSRIAGIAYRVPSIAHWAMSLADELAVSAEMEFTRDDLFRLGSDLGDILPEYWKDDDPTRILNESVKYGHYADGVRCTISNSIAAGGLELEVALAVRHGWVKDEQEWRTFTANLQAIGLQSATVDIRSILPPGMM